MQEDFSKSNIPYSVCLSSHVIKTMHYAQKIQVFLFHFRPLVNLSFEIFPLFYIFFLHGMVGADFLKDVW